MLGIWTETSLTYFWTQARSCYRRTDKESNRQENIYWTKDGFVENEQDNNYSVLAEIRAWYLQNNHNTRR
jgi:hypothetical protein